MKNNQQDRRRVQKFAAAIGGGAVLIVGLIAIPYPGPGWLIVLAGLAILAREFEWAGRLLRRVKKHYDAWEAWVKRQPITIKVLLGLFSTIIVVLTIYILNGYGILNQLLGLNQDWVQSPLFD